MQFSIFNLQNRFDRSFSPSSGLSGSIKRMPYPTYPSNHNHSSNNNNNSSSTRPWSPLSHSTSYEYSGSKQHQQHQQQQPAVQPKRDISRNGSSVKLVSTSSTPANLLIADLANPWREIDTVDAKMSRGRGNKPRQQTIELREKPSRLKMLSDSAYKMDDSESRSTFYPERDFPGKVPWGYKRNRPEETQTVKQKVKFEKFDKDEVYPSVMAPNYKLQFVEESPHSNGGAISRSIPSKQYIGSSRKVSDSDGRKLRFDLLS